MIKRVEGLVFDIGRQAPYKELHSVALLVLKDMYELENQIIKQSQKNDGFKKNKNASNLSVFDEEAEEIQKVERKLRKWAKEQDSVPSKILNAYLLLERGGSININKGILAKAISLEYGDTFKFSTNFDQMKNIEPKNHAKIFDVGGLDVGGSGIIKIWAPIERYVRSYEKYVFEK